MIVTSLGISAGAEGIVQANLVQTLVNKLKNELDEIKVRI